MPTFEISVSDAVFAWASGKDLVANVDGYKSEAGDRRCQITRGWTSRWLRMQAKVGHWLLFPRPSMDLNKLSAGHFLRVMRATRLSRAFQANIQKPASRNNASRRDGALSQLPAGATVYRSSTTNHAIIAMLSVVELDIAGAEGGCLAKCGSSTDCGQG